MSDGAKVNGVSEPIVGQQQAVSAAITSLLVTQANLILGLGAPLNVVVDALFDVACNLVAAIEPKPVRDGIISNLAGNLPKAIAMHYEARHTRPSGLIVPAKQ